MVNGQKIDFEMSIAGAFGLGFANAARSLAQMTKNQVAFNSIHSKICRLQDNYFVDNAYKQHNEGSRILLTTEIFGDLTGKSYLFLSEKEYDVLTMGIPGSTSSINLKDEFLKELDNVLTAAVISKLSNELNKKMFGHIPTLAGKTKSKLEDIVNDDFPEQAQEFYISSISFSLENQPSFQPLFLWIVDFSTTEVENYKRVGYG